MERVVKLPIDPKIGLLAGIVTLAACSTPDTPGAIHDPYEPWNRTVHGVNKGADRVFFRPASRVYGNVVPTPVRRGLSNASSNLSGPRNVVNDVLQGDLEDAGHNLTRFILNTTVGVFGIFDPASGSFGIEARDTGFGDTLATWGTPEGAYLELLIFGPSTERDAFGQVVDIFTNPLDSVFDEASDIAAATSLPSVLNSRFELGDSVDSVLYDSADSYAQLRLFYLESRRFQLSGQTSAENAFDPYENLYEEVYEGLYDEF
ncbi:MAG: VacJ family lipoprotein [Pseudomonadota bacterium]